MCGHAKSLSMSKSWQPCRLQPARLLCPRDSPGSDTGVGWPVLLQGIFPTQGSNPRHQQLLHWQAGSLPLSHWGSLGEREISHKIWLQGE